MKTSVLLGAALASAALAGCVNVGGKAVAPAQLFTLTAPAVSGAGVAARAGDALVVGEPDAERALGVTRIAVQADDHSVAYLKTGLWAERPARLFRNLLADTIRAGGKHLVLVDDADGPLGGQRLSGRLAMFSYDARSHAAVVQFDALARAGDGSLRQQRFSASVPVESPRGPDVAQGLNVAAGKVAAQVADWLR